MYRTVSARNVKLGLLIIVGLSALVTGFGGQERESAMINVPATESSRRNPYAGDPVAPVAGKKLFRRHCAQCHGPGGVGSTRGPGLGSNSVRSATPGALFWFLTNGNLKRGMPSWSGLSEQRRWQIVTYVKSLDKSSASSMNEKLD